MCDIISIVKVKQALTTLFCGVLSATALLTGAALSHAENADAASAKTHYPEVFTGNINDEMPAITDFATDGETFVFADRSCIMKVSGGERIRYDVRAVSALDFSGGKFYYRVGTQAYTLGDDEAVEYTFRTDFPSPPDGDYKILESEGVGSVYYCAKSALNFEKIAGADGVTRLKVYKNTVYALKADGVYKLNGLNAPESVNPSYTDFSDTQTVSVGTAVDDLKSYNLTSPHMAMLERGAYFTEIVLNNLLGAEYFTVGETYTDADGIFPYDDAVLILCETGNAAIFTYGGKNYVTLSQNCVQLDSALSTVAFTQAIVSAENCAYAAPYVGDALKSFNLKAGEVVKVIGMAGKNSAVNDEFYLVEHTSASGKTEVGYMLTDMVIGYFGDESPSSPDDKNYQQVADPEYSDKDLVKVVILVIVIILLVLIALGYLVYVATGKKNNKNN